MEDMKKFIKNLQSTLIMTDLQHGIGITITGDAVTNLKHYLSDCESQIEQGLLIEEEQRGEISRLRWKNAAYFASRNEYRAELARLREQERWILVTERKPGHPGWVIVQTDTGFIYPGTYERGQWYNDIRELDFSVIVAWKELPK